jgi:membrane protein YdbS with pleckstrin-like domain
MQSRYRVHGKDDGESVSKIFEAETGDAARSMAEAIGLEILAIEVINEGHQSPSDAPESEAPKTDNPLGDSAVELRDKPEQEIWEASPSQWINFWWFSVCLPGIFGTAFALTASNSWWYLLCILLIPIPWALWQAISTRKTDYAITSQRLTLETGVFKRDLEEIELYRIKDTRLTRSFVQRLLGLGTVTVISSDESMPTLVIPAIKDSAKVRQIIRENVELVRRARGVRELDMN